MRGASEVPHQGRTTEVNALTLEALQKRIKELERDQARGGRRDNGASRKPTKFTGRCWKCNKKGHKEWQCKEGQRENNDDVNTTAT